MKNSNIHINIMYIILIIISISIIILITLGFVFIYNPHLINYNNNYYISTTKEIPKNININNKYTINLNIKNKIDIEFNYQSDIIIYTLPSGIYTSTIFKDYCKETFFSGEYLLVSDKNIEIKK